MTRTLAAEWGPYGVRVNAVRPGLTETDTTGDMVNNKVIEGISDIRDLSDRNGIRVEIELKKDAYTQVILNKLFKQTQLQVSYGIIFLALVDGRPRVLNLQEMLSEYIAHRREVVIRRTRFELSQAEKRAHILEGLKIALDFIDEVIKIIRRSKTVDEARKSLMNRFKLTEVQANAILDMRLQKLTSLESQKIIEELKVLKAKIRDLKKILKDESLQYGIVSDELGEVVASYKGERATEVDHSSVDSVSFEVTDLIAEEEVVITVTEDGFVKRMSKDTFRRQRRGGKGVKGSSIKREDVVRMMCSATTHDTLLFFSNKGKVFGMKVFEVPEASRESRGKSLKAILNLAGEEVITAICGVRDFTKGYLAMVSRGGILKKTDLEVFTNAKKGGIIAINLRKDDELMDVRLVLAKEDIIIGSRMGLALRTNVSKMRSQGRGASGIIGMRLGKDDHIIGMDVIKPKSALLVVSEKGFGKRMSYSNFASKGRGGKGMTYLKIIDKNGPAVALATVKEEDDIILVAKSGMVIRLSAADISQIGRVTVGVKIVNLKAGDAVNDVAIFADDRES